MTQLPKVTKREVAAAASDFLMAVGKMVRAELGESPRCQQRSQWMVPTGPTTMGSKEFEREVFNSIGVSMAYQIMMHPGFPEQQQLEDVLVKADIPREEIWYGFFVPLVHNWCEQSRSLQIGGAALSKVIGEFVNAVVDKKILTRLRSAIEGITLSSGPVELEKGTTIRPIEIEEQWEFGDTNRFFPWSWRQMPSEQWVIIDIEREADLQDIGNPWLTRNAILTALVLLSSGRFSMFELKHEVNYGIRGGMTPIEPAGGRRISLWGGSYVLDEKLTQLLRETWPRIKRMVQSEGHYLALPARRLLDGAGRRRVDDAIVDYSIGLEALLTEAVPVELKYRFSLRGATILSWESGKKGECFDDLQHFYNIRSDIVHGRRVSKEELNRCRAIGENAVRGIWWWYYNSGFSKLRDAISLVDSRIEGRSTHTD